jgi:ribonuclease P protein component
VEFIAVQKGERRSTATVRAQALRRGDSSPCRVGFTTTKKIGNAVVRNRARRRLREAARALAPEFALPGVDYVFLATETTATAPWPDLLDDMKQALVRLAAALRAKEKSAAAGVSPQTRGGRARRPGDDDPPKEEPS